MQLLGKYGMYRINGMHASYIKLAYNQNCLLYNLLEWTDKTNKSIYKYSLQDSVPEFSVISSL